MTVFSSAYGPEQTAQRRDQLLVKLQYSIITREEAIELTGILEEEKQKAKNKGDAATLIAVILGLALLASIVAKSRS